MPDHHMMVGITAWQQQVPLPQPYSGANAWRIPLRPVPAANPMSAKDNFFRGAIALAANGVPIYNPIKNDGKTDTFLAGELDELGGHCGRGPGRRPALGGHAQGHQGHGGHDNQGHAGARVEGQGEGDDHDGEGRRACGEEK